jgi:hypothetical protein
MSSLGGRTVRNLVVGGTAPLLKAFAIFSKIPVFPPPGREKPRSTTPTSRGFSHSSGLRSSALPRSFPHIVFLPTSCLLLYAPTLARCRNSACVSRACVEYAPSMRLSLSASSSQSIFSAPRSCAPAWLVSLHSRLLPIPFLLGCVTFGELRSSVFVATPRG